MSNFNLNSNIVFGTPLLGDDVVWSIQSVNLPGLNLGFNKVQSRHDVLSGTVTNRALEYSALTMSVITDENMKVWKEIMRAVITSKDSNGDVDGWISITDSTGKPILKMSFHNVIITSVGDLEYSTTGSNEELVFDIEIQYDYYDIDIDLSLSDEVEEVES